jgi:hypothetical protein
VGDSLHGLEAAGARGRPGAALDSAYEQNTAADCAASGVPHPEPRHPRRRSGR